MASAQELLGFERLSSLIVVEAIPSPSQDSPKLAGRYLPISGDIVPA
jgi:hypothetical protein